MPGRRPYKRRVYAKYGKAEVGYEWCGFRDAGTPANLNTQVGFELLPPVSDTTVGSSQFVIVRIVGTLELLHQAGVVTRDRCGIVLVSSHVGDDQTVDEAIDPLSTDIDEFADKQIMWWWSGNPEFPTAAVDTDIVPWRIPVDIKVRRVIKKRMRLEFQAKASSTGRLAMCCNVRALIKHR